MYGLNAVALVFFGCINVSAYRLCKCRHTVRKTAVTVLCSVLLAVNIIRYGIVYPFIIDEPSIPVEFSTVAYFVVPFILLISKKNFHAWAAYSGLMAGFFYYLALIFAGGAMYGDYGPIDVYISMFCHGAIYFCGITVIGTELCDRKDILGMAAGVALVAVHAALVRPLVRKNRGLLIYILLDGICVKRFVPQELWNVVLPTYYICISLLVLLTIHGFFRRNRKNYGKFTAAKNAQTD